MTTEERREYDRKRWHRRYANPEFRRKEAERSKKRRAEWRSIEKNRECDNARARAYYWKNREKILAKLKARREQRKAQEEAG